MCFFFSSRRRHTRLQGDWSSDVCSSDLAFTNGTTNTWPIVLYSAVRFGITPAVNALATIMLGLTVVAVVITAVVLRRSRAQVGPGQEQTRGLGAAIGLG